MDVLRIYHDTEGRTLTVWFDDPSKEEAAEETGEEVILIKDRHGHVIGFERLNYTPPPTGPLQIELVEA